MAFVNTALETALKRNQKRARKVPTEIVTQKWNEVQQNIGTLQSYFGNQNFLIVDNNTEYQIETQEYANLMLQLFKQGKRLLESPLRNPIGKRFIQLMRQEGVSYLSNLSVGQELTTVMGGLKP